MSLSADQLRCIPLLRGFTDEHLARLVEVFEPMELAEGDVLFAEGSTTRAFYVLAEGEIAIREGDQPRFQLHPVAPIGELGALAGVPRSTTAVACKPSRVWAVPRETLLELLQGEAGIARRFYANFMAILGDKVRRDQLRIADMRANIIRTQKAMKRLRDLVLESADSPISEPLHDELDRLITDNRRVNYRVRPPDALPAGLRADDGTVLPVVQVSRTHLSCDLGDAPLPPDGSRWSGVLCLSGPEVPISARVLRTIERRVDLELDLLIDEYVAVLEGYLTRVQMLDFMV